MSHLLDSDIVIDYLASEPATVGLVARLAPQRLAVSVVSYMEVYQGIGRGPNGSANLAALHRFLADAPVMPFTLAEAQRCAQIRETLLLMGRRVRSRELDLMVAATAVEHNLILVTRNVRDYRSIPGIQLYGPI